MVNHVHVRDRLVDDLIAELHGPSKHGSPYTIPNARIFATWDESRGPWKDAATGEEILNVLTPNQQYGIGVLQPVGKEDPESNVNVETPTIAGGLEEQGDDGQLPIEEGAATDVLRMVGGVAGSIDDEDDLGDIDSGLERETSLFRGQSSLGLSFLVDYKPGTILNVELTGGRYDDFYPSIKDKPNPQWWVRRPINATLPFELEALNTGRPVKRLLKFPKDKPLLEIEISVKTRRFRDDPSRLLVTVAITNRSESRSIDKSSLFQTKLRCQVDGRAAILPYPTSNTVALSPDERSANLLYRDVAPFAVGHGCAANWTFPDGDSQRATEVCTETIPSIVVPPITPDIPREGGSLTVSMFLLAEASQATIRSHLAELLVGYRTWIAKQEARVSTLPTEELRETGKEHLAVCRQMADRIDEGIAYIETDSTAARAFVLANRAMLFQRVRSRNIRKQVSDTAAGRVGFDAPFQSLEETLASGIKAEWRPFQLAFLLANLKSVVQGNDPNRATVDLLWFPTGGGKTEAYLGLAAFTIFHRRLKNAQDSGTTVLMRYTLRLLTAQQFQRASALICAMDYIRAEYQTELGTKPIRIGMWVGGGSTPNRSSHAVDLLSKLKKHESNLDASFILDRCPWCGAQLIPDSPFGRARLEKKRSPSRWGYERAGDTVKAVCTDPACPFRSGLPISVIDDVLYSNPPEFLLGTVDKFAQLAWRPDARVLFGLNAHGDRASSPPSLIIQDELHLIAGPLGSIAGGYEPVIEDLCTDRRGDFPIPPKIIASTATIQGYREHVLALFGRSEVALFPPPGLDANESYFARVARDKNGTEITGKRYLGILAPGYKSHQNAISRVIGTMHQSVGQLEPDSETRNPWWTNLLFFGSLRELGNCLTLLSAGIPTFIKVTARRSGRTQKDQRFIRNPIELTGRLSGSEVPKQLSAIELDYQIDGDGKQNWAVDLCLATNIIEVGVDVDRLSLMTVIGQPKSMASYIQATGRVGRRWDKQPGLILTVYSPTRARDRSYYEQFRSVHERLYAQVEPTTLTPFAPPALERTMHCALLAYVRQHIPEKDLPDPTPTALIDQFWDVFSTRLTGKFEQFREPARAVFEKRKREWTYRRPTRWESKDATEVGLAYHAGEYVPDLVRTSAWPVLGSMRNVDADCRLAIPWPADTNEAAAEESA